MSVEPAAAHCHDQAINENQLQGIVEGALFAAHQPLSIDRLRQLFSDTQRPSNAQISNAIAALQVKYAETSGLALREVGSGFRFQVKPEFSPWVAKLWEEKPARYSRALLETLALIAYRQPITRGEIEEIRGVAVSSTIIKTLLEREWVKVVGHRDVPGRPALYASTQLFLDYFNLASLDKLPPLTELIDLESFNAEAVLIDKQAAQSDPQQALADLSKVAVDEAEDGPVNETIAADMPVDEVQEALDVAQEGNEAMLADMSVDEVQEATDVVQEGLDGSHHDDHR